MNKHTFRTISLQKGEINLYDFGAIKLHAYKTNDPMDDEVFIFEKRRPGRGAGVALLLRQYRGAQRLPEGYAG